MNIIYDFLRSDGSVVVNKKLIHAIGLHEAILYSELLSKRSYFDSRGQLENGYFYNTAENLHKDTGLSAKQQRKAIKTLEELGLIKTHLHGVPARKFFKIVDDINLLASVMIENTQLGTLGTSRMAERLQQAEQKGNGNNTNIILKNNTKHTLVRVTNECVFISFYLSCFHDVYGKQHMRVKESDLDYIDEKIEEIKECLDYEEYTEMVVTYFEQLPESNNGNILSFLTAKDRYLQCYSW